MNPRRQPCLQPGDCLLYLLNNLDHIGIRLLEDRHDHGPFAVEPSPLKCVFRAIDHLGYRGEGDRNPIGLRDDQGLIIRGICQLVIGSDRVGAVSSLNGTPRGKVIGVGQEFLDVVHAHSQTCQMCGINLDPHRRLGSSGE